MVDTLRKADTMSTMADTKRKRSRRSFSDEFKAGAVRLVLEEGLEQLERGLESLDEPQREVIVLRKFEELSFTEIGERMGRSPDACRMLLARAMTALTLSMQEMP